MKDEFNKKDVFNMSTLVWRAVRGNDIPHELISEENACAWFLAKNSVLKKRQTGANVPYLEIHHNRQLSMLLLVAY